MNTAVSLREIRKTFGPRTVIADATAQFESGRMYALTGPNGSGKTVLLKIILGFVRPDSGDIEVDPLISDPRSPFRENFGVTLDPPGYLGHKSAYENLKILSEIRGIATDTDINESLQRFGLGDVGALKVKHFSLGMRQKLALAQATFENQRVLLLDEPFNGLDRQSVPLVHDILKQFRDEGRTIIFTSHSNSDIDTLADQVYEFVEGRLSLLERSV